MTHTLAPGVAPGMAPTHSSCFRSPKQPRLHSKHEECFCVYLRHVLGRNLKFSDLSLKWVSLKKLVRVPWSDQTSKKCSEVTRKAFYLIFSSSESLDSVLYESEVGGPPRGPAILVWNLKKFENFQFRGDTITQNSRPPGPLGGPPTSDS